MKIPANILVIEDDAMYRKTLEKVLKKENYGVFSVQKETEALSTMKKNRIDLILSDVRLPGGKDGIDILEEINDLELEYQPVIIIMTGYADNEAPIRAIKVGVDDYLMKPFSTEKLKESIKEKLEARIKYFINEENLDDRFVKRVNSLQKRLKMIKGELKALDLNLTKKDKVSIIKKYKEKYFGKLLEDFSRLNSIVDDFDQKEYELHKTYIKNKLLSLFNPKGSELNKQIVDKPLGYAGDYVVADYFYNEAYSGKNLYAMFMDRFTIETPLPQAHKNRRLYLRKVIKKLIKRNENKELQVTSFACGPAPEVFDTLNKGFVNVKFNLLDGESEVLAFLKRKGEKFETFSKQTNLFHSNILNLVRKKEPLPLKKQDLIYCAGFFDYIKDSTATRFINYMLDHLKKGGWLIILNVSMHEINDVCLKMLADWELNHRSEERLLSLVKNEEIRQKKVLPDFCTKRNLYLIIKI